MTLDATKNFLIVTVSQGYGSTDTSITLHTGEGHYYQLHHNYIYIKTSSGWKRATLATL